MRKSLLVLLILGAFFAGAAFDAAGSASADFFDFLKRFSPDERPSLEQPVELEPYKSVVQYEEAIINAVDSGSKSVVSIVVTKDLPILERCPYNPYRGFNDDLFREFFGNDSPFYTRCETGKTEKREIGGGTGFAVSDNGLIITNKHVVADETADYTVLTNDGEKHKANVVARDPVQDIAIIKIDNPPGDLVPAKLGDSSTLRLGQTVIAIGNALGEFRNTVSVGVVSGLSRSITASDGRGARAELDNLIQTDAAINPGNSGGPLLNLKGEVIGINTAMASGAQSIGFAIPINTAKRDIESVKHTGEIKFPFMGVRYQMVTKDFAENQNLPVSYGALIYRSEDGPGIFPKSPAEAAGLKIDDIILEINGVVLKDGKDLAQEIQKHNVGDRVKLKVYRDGKTINITVTLGERPESI